MLQTEEMMEKWGTEDNTLGKELMEIDNTQKKSWLMENISRQKRKQRYKKDQWQLNS